MKNDNKSDHDMVRRYMRYIKLQRNLTPNTLFGPEHFEQYLAQSKMPTGDERREEAHVDLGEYAKREDDGLF